MIEGHAEPMDAAGTNSTSPHSDWASVTSRTYWSAMAWGSRSSAEKGRMTYKSGDEGDAIDRLEVPGAQGTILRGRGARC